MTDISKSGTYQLGSRRVHRMGYGAMQLAGPGVFGPPRDRDGALAVLRAAVAAGVDHIDTSDFYGPHVTNQLIKEALHPYPASLTIVTKVGAVRGSDASWLPAMKPEDLVRGVEGNLRTLGVEAMEVANLRIVGTVHEPTEGSIAEQFGAMLDLQRRGLVRHIGLSNVTATQIAEARAMGAIVCVQNQYNIVYRVDDALVDSLAEAGIAYVPYFPLGGFSPLQSSILSNVARDVGASEKQVALAWLLQRAPNILLIPGTSSVEHLHDNLTAATLTLPPASVSILDGIAKGA